jgi:sRNA-binding protein
VSPTVRRLDIIGRCAGVKQTVGAARTASHASEALASGLSGSYLIVSPGGVRLMPSTYQIERNRGTKDARQQLAVLGEKWPLAFPAKDQDVRPLAVGAAREIAAAMGWPLPYTLGVLVGWKMAPAYCEAVIRYDQRVALDGSPAEAIDAEARELATKQLARLPARETAKEAAKAAAAVVVKPKPVAAPPTKTPSETPDQLRGRVRASLLRRRA